MNFFLDVFKLSILLPLLILAGCGGSSDDNNKGEEPLKSQILTFTKADNINLSIGNTHNNPASSDGSGVISYQSNNVDVASVDANGTVIALAVGEALITANITADSVFSQANSTSYKVVVSLTQLVSSFTISGQHLMATSSNVPNNDGFTYQWFIDDSLVSELSIFDASQYSNLHTVKLITTDSDGVSYSHALEIDFDEKLYNQTPVSSFTTSGNILIATSSDDLDSAKLTYQWFMNDTLVSEISTFDTSSYNGEYTVKLTTTDSDGVSHTHSLVMDFGLDTNNQAPISSFTVNDNTLTATSTDDGGDENLTHQWFVDDTAIGTGNTWDASAQTTTVTIKLISTDAQGLPHSIEQRIDFFTDVINYAPISVFTFKDEILTATSTDNRGAGNLTHQWFANDEVLGTGKTWDTSKLTGTVTIKLTSTDIDGLSDSTAQMIDFGNADPVAIATADTTSGKTPLIVFFDGAASTDFEDDANNSTLIYSWVFSDGTSSNKQALTKVFDTAKNFTASLTVTDSANASNTGTLINITATDVAVDLPPIALFTTNVTSGDTPLVVNFDANSASDDNGITSYSWDFGDGTALHSGITTSHTYTAADTYTAILTVTDSQNQTATISTNITVSEVVYLPPVASFTTNVTSGDIPLVVSFDANSSSSEGVISSYSWDFGDGSVIGYGATITHTYTTKNTFTAVLTVTDSNNQTNSINHTITADESATPSDCSDVTLDFCADFEEGILPNNLTAAGSYTFADIGYKSNKSVKVSAGSQNFFKVVPPAADFWARVFIRSEGDSNGSSFGGNNQGLARAHGVLLKGTEGSAQMRVGDHRCQLEINRDGGADHLGDDLEMTSGSYGSDNTVCNETYGARMNTDEWYCLEVHFNGSDSEVQVFWDNQNVEQLHVTADRTWTNEDKSPGGAYSANSDKPWGTYDFDLFQFGYESFNNNGAPANEFWYDNVAVSTQRVGCGDDYVVNAPLDDSTKLQSTSNGYPYTDNTDVITLTPAFTMSEDAMVVTVDGSTSTGSADFTYEWDFDGENTDSASGVNASYTFATAGEKNITLTLISGNTSQTVEKTITIVDTVYADLLARVSKNIVGATCIGCHVTSRGKPLKFDSAAPDDVEAGISAYLILIGDVDDSAQKLIDVANGIGHGSGDVITAPGNELDWEALVTAIDAKQSKVINGNVIFTEDFEDYTVGSFPTDWGYFIAYQDNIFDFYNSAHVSKVIIENNVERGGNVVHLINSSASEPVQIVKDIPRDTRRMYLRMYMKQSVDIGRTPGNNHASLITLRGSLVGENRNETELRFGDAKGVLGVNLNPTDGIAPIYYEQAGQLSGSGLANAALITKDEWHCIEVAYLDDGDVSQMFVWNDDIEVFALESLQDFADGGPTESHWMAEQFGQVVIGWQGWGAGINSDIWIDDIIASDERIGCN